MAKTKTTLQVKRLTRKHGSPGVKSARHRKAASAPPSPKSRGRGSSASSGMPATIARSDRHAQSLWRRTRASAIKTYGEGARASRVAFSALKHEYEKQGDHWVRKAENGPSDAQAARGPTTHPRSTDKPTRTGGGRVTRTSSARLAKSS